MWLSQLLKTTFKSAPGTNCEKDKITSTDEQI